MIDHGRLAAASGYRVLAGFPRRNVRGLLGPAPERARQGETAPLPGTDRPRHLRSVEAVPAEAEGACAGAPRAEDAAETDSGWHQHAELELCWVRAGRGTRFVGDHEAAFEAGDLVLIGPNLPHCYHREDQHSPLIERATIHVSPGMFGQPFLDLVETQAIAGLLRNSGRGWHVGGRAAERVRELMRNLPGEVALPRLLVVLQILETLAQATGDLTPLASHDYLARGANRANVQRIDAIRAYVRENLTEDIHQARAAQLVGLTPSAFSRFFRKATGHTFVQFVNQLRIGEACRMLAETDCGITEIAFGCGYWSIANFNRQFLRIKGMNPTRFRERRIGTPANCDAAAMGNARCDTG